MMMVRLNVCVIIYKKVYGVVKKFNLYCECQQNRLVGMQIGCIAIFTFHWLSMFSVLQIIFFEFFSSFAIDFSFPAWYNNIVFRSGGVLFRFRSAPRVLRGGGVQHSIKQASGIPRGCKEKHLWNIKQASSRKTSLKGTKKLPPQMPPWLLCSAKIPLKRAH